jgi:hypothetical protein
MYSNHVFLYGTNQSIEPEEGTDPKDASFVAKQLGGDFTILYWGMVQLNSTTREGGLGLQKG